MKELAYQMMQDTMELLESAKFDRSMAIERGEDTSYLDARIAGFQKEIDKLASICF